MDIDIQSPDNVLDERNGVYVTSIPGCARWFNGPESLDSLSLEETSLLRGDKDRTVAHGQKEIGVVVKCYSGLENSLKVCDLVEFIGILEMPDEQIEDEEASSEFVIHAITMQKKKFSNIILENHGRLSTCKALHVFD